MTMKRLILHMTLLALSAISGAVAAATPLRSALCRETIQPAYGETAHTVSNDPDTVIILPWFDDELADDIHMLDTANIEPDTIITDYYRTIFPIPA